MSKTPTEPKKNDLQDVLDNIDNPATPTGEPARSENKVKARRPRPAAPPAGPERPEMRSAHDYLLHVRNSTPGEESEQIAAWMAEDAGAYSKQMHLTAVRILIGVAMVADYGTPKRKEMKVKRAEVAAKYGMKLRRAYDYMNAATCFYSATELHSTDEGAEDMLLPVAALNREIQDVPNFIRCWLAGEDADAKADRLAHAIVLDLDDNEEDDDEDDDEPKTRKSRATFEKQGEAYLTKLFNGDGAAIKDGLVAHIRQAERRLMDFTDHVAVIPAVEVLDEYEAIVNRAVRTQDPESVLDEMMVKLQTAILDYRTRIKPMQDAEDKANADDAEDQEERQNAEESGEAPDEVEKQNADAPDAVTNAESVPVEEPKPVEEATTDEPATVTDGEVKS